MFLQKKIKNKYLSLFVLSFLLLLLIFFASMPINKPFLLDEFYFINAAIEVVSSGTSSIYITGGALAAASTHPTLYIYLLAMSFKIFGISEISARIIGILFSSGTIILIYFLSLEIFKDEKNKHLIAIASSIIYTINPFVIQSTLLIDMDGSMLPFGVTLFILAFVKTRNMKDYEKLPILGALFGLLLWIKFATPVFIMLSLFAFYMINKCKKEVKNFILIAVTGSVLFLITWFIYCYFNNVQFLRPFQYNLGALGSGFFKAQSFYPILRALAGIKSFLFWTTPFFLLMLVVILSERIKNFITTKKLMYRDLLLLCGMMIVIIYSFIYSLAYGFPKYYASSIPFFSILIGDLIVRSDVSRILKEKYLKSFAVIGLVIIYLIYVVKDPIIFPWKQESDTFMYLYQNFYSSFITFMVYTTIIYLSPVFIYYMLFKILKINLKNSQLIVISLIFALISTSIYIDGIQSRAKYSTMYNYGETGLREVASYINNHTDKNEIIFANYEVGYYAARKTSNLSIFDFIKCPESEFIQCQNRLQENIKLKNINYLVFRKDDLWNPEVYNFINSKYMLESKIGSFEIYKKVK